MQAPNAAREHERKVAGLAEHVRGQLRRREPLYLQKRGVRHVVPLPRDERFAGRPLDVRALDAVLDLDPEARICTAEPGVSFATLVDATLRHGLLPAVVPELEGITVGGAVAGCSVESASFRYGGFHDACLEYEVVTGAGDVLTLSRTVEPLLFEMLHGSYGTLAILTRLRFWLLPAQSYVGLEYRRFGDVVRFFAAMREAVTSGGHDFIDAIVHGPEEMVLCLGTFTAAPPYVSRYGLERPYYASTRERDEDYLSTRDYCFRFDADCHWLARSVPGLEWPPLRRVLGPWVLGSTNLIRWSERLRPILARRRRPPVVCDVFIPERRFLDFYTWYERSFAHYPLWVVPYRAPRIYPWIAPRYAERMGGELFIDCAVYGKPNEDPVIDASAQLEARTYACDGIKTLISRNHYTRERFWEVYNEPAYRAAKARLDPHGLFPELYEKLHRVA